MANSFTPHKQGHPFGRPTFTYPRALQALLREMNITLWALDKTCHCDITPLIHDIAAYGQHLNLSEALRRAGLDRNVLYRARVRCGAMTFQTVMRLLHGMGLRLRVEVAPNHLYGGPLMKHPPVEYREKK